MYLAGANSWDTEEGFSLVKAWRGGEDRLNALPGQAGCAETCVASKLCTILLFTGIVAYVAGRAWMTEPSPDDGGGGFGQLPLPDTPQGGLIVYALLSGGRSTVKNFPLLDMCIPLPCRARYALQARSGTSVRHPFELIWSSLGGTGVESWGHLKPAFGWILFRIGRIWVVHTLTGSTMCGAHCSRRAYMVSVHRCLRSPTLLRAGANEDSSSYDVGA